jgi:hypothetical protein
MFLSSAALRCGDGAADHGTRQHDWHATCLLLVSYDWNPLTGGPEALAGRRLAAALLDAGARVHVLTASAGAQLASPRYGVTVVPDAEVPENRLRLGLAMMRHRIPEPYFHWVREATTAGERVLAGLPPQSVIYGRAMPGCSNLVAWHLARTSGRPFIAHFSDEWPAVQLLTAGALWAAPYKLPLFRMWRHRIFRDAAALTFTNPDQARAVLRDDGRHAMSRSFVVTHLSGRTGRAPVPQRRERFHIVHTGNLNPPGHTAAALLCGLRAFLDRTPAAVGRVRFTQAGWSAGDIPQWIDRLDLQSIARAVGRVTPEAVLDLLDDANLLVGFDYTRPDSATLLSKLPDYVAARRPILVMAAPDSAMGRLFESDGVGMTAAYDSPEEVADCLARAFEAWATGSDALLPTAAAIEGFSRDRVLEEFAGAVRTAQGATAVSPRAVVARARRAPRAVAS